MKSSRIDAVYGLYTFRLYFHELSEELQEQKIDFIITNDYEEGAFADESGNKKYNNVREALADEELRYDTRQLIEAHFPICF